MATAQIKPADNNVAAIFARLWESPDYPLTPELARHVLNLRFSERDKMRMHQLAVKNQEGSLSPKEDEELDNFVKVGDLLAILQSKARKLLKPGIRPVGTADNSPAL